MTGNLDRHQKEFITLIKVISQRHHVHEIFRDFCEISAISLSNAFDRTQFKIREERYLQIIKRYSKEELTLFAKMLRSVVESLDFGLRDCLGEIFMELELGNHWRGQFFTPYHMCCFMGKITLSNASDVISKRGFIRVTDPAAGSGAMVIGAAQVLQESGLNYQQQMHIVARDIDATAVHMAYIHFSLLAIPAVVIQGDTLADTVLSIWYTPAHMTGLWGVKLKRLQAEEVDVSEVQQAVIVSSMTKQSEIEKRNVAIEQLQLFG